MHGIGRVFENFVSELFVKRCGSSAIALHHITSYLLSSNPSSKGKFVYVYYSRSVWDKYPRPADKETIQTNQEY